MKVAYFTCKHSRWKWPTSHVNIDDESGYFTCKYRRWKWPTSHVNIEDESGLLHM
jgi:hypothetical protein